MTSAGLPEPPREYAITHLAGRTGQTRNQESSSAGNHSRSGSGYEVVEGARRWVVEYESDPTLRDTEQIPLQGKGESRAFCGTRFCPFVYGMGRRTGTTDGPAERNRE